VSVVIAVRDDGSYEAETIEELAKAGLTAVTHPWMDGWLLIDSEGLHGSDPEDVEFELFMHSFTSRLQEDGHEWLAPGEDSDTPLDCAVPGCGMETRDHLPASVSSGQKS